MKFKIDFVIKIVSSGKLFRVDFISSGYKWFINRFASNGIMEPWVVRSVGVAYR